MTDHKKFIGLAESKIKWSYSDEQFGQTMVVTSKRVGIAAASIKTGAAAGLLLTLPFGLPKLRWSLTPRSSFRQQA
ncbi:MAG: hypothetical protein ACRD82_20705 [Blastocatellia bacterium]